MWLILRLGIEDCFQRLVFGGALLTVSYQPMARFAPTSNLFEQHEAVASRISHKSLVSLPVAVSGIFDCHAA